MAIFRKIGSKSRALREELPESPDFLSAVIRRYTLRIRSYTAFIRSYAVFMPYLLDRFLPESPVGQSPPNRASPCHPLSTRIGSCEQSGTGSNAFHGKNEYYSR
jgi:hypothetical protein